MYIYICITRTTFFPRAISEQNSVYLFADHHYASDGYFAWPAWWIEFTSRSRFNLLLFYKGYECGPWWINPSRKFLFLSRNFFCRNLWRKGVGKPKRKNFCPDGAMSPKPTGLLLLNLPKMLQVLRSSQITPGIPWGTSIGRGHDGA